MRPKIFTFRKIFLLVAALGIFGGLAYWGSRGFPLPFAAVPSTAGKLVFAWEKDGQTDVYLVSATGGEPVQLNKDAPLEGELAFSLDGQQLAFTAERGQRGVRQICMTEAGAGRKVIALTTTQSTKEFPVFHGERDLYYLDSGKVARTTTDASDSDAIFPTVEERRDNALLRTLFAEGGVARFVISPNGELILVAVKRERGEVLVAIALADKTVAILGSAQKIYFQALSDNTFTVLFNSGTPLTQAMSLPKPKTPEEDQGVGEQLGIALNQLASQMEALEGKSYLVHFSTTLVPETAIPLPVTPTGFSIASDNQTVGIYSEGTDTPESAGLFVLVLGSQEAPQRLYDKPVREISWSPDGSSLAFLSEGSVLVTPKTGSSSPLNLTQGKGRASSLVWSPAQPKK